MQRKPVKSSSPLHTLRNNLKGKSRSVFEILNEVRKVNPNHWRDPSKVEQLAKDLTHKLGLSVPEARIKQLVNAYKDATKNGPTATVDELLQKYGKNMDEETAKEIKKFVRRVK